MKQKKQQKESKHHFFSFFGILSVVVIVAFFSILIDAKSTGMATQTERTYLSCLDSDYDNQFRPGTATLTYIEKGIQKSEVVADSCSGNNLKEAICNNGKLTSQNSVCVSGCGKTSLASYCKCNTNSQCGNGYGCVKSLCVKNK